MNQRHLGAAFAIAFIAGTAGAVAQNAQTLTIAPADQSKIQTWVMQQNKSSMSAPAGFTLTVGATLPQTIQLNTFAADVGVPSVSSYSYVVMDGKTVLVDPQSRKIIQILG